MRDALFAVGVVLALNYIAAQERASVPTLVAVHDAFLVPAGASHFLPAAIEGAGQLWLPKLGPVYEALERYLPSDHAYGQLVREWWGKGGRRGGEWVWAGLRLAELQDEPGRRGIPVEHARKRARWPFREACRASGPRGSLSGKY